MKLVAAASSSGSIWPLLQLLLAVLLGLAAGASIAAFIFPAPNVVSPASVHSPSSDSSPSSSSSSTSPSSSSLTEAAVGDVEKAVGTFEIDNIDRASSLPSLLLRNKQLRVAVGKARKQAAVTARAKMARLKTLLKELKAISDSLSLSIFINDIHGHPKGAPPIDPPPPPPPGLTVDGDPYVPSAIGRVRSIMEEMERRERDEILKPVKRCFDLRRGQRERQEAIGEVLQSLLSSASRLRLQRQLLPEVADVFSQERLKELEAAAVGTLINTDKDFERWRAFVFWNAHFPFLSFRVNKTATPQQELEAAVEAESLKFQELKSQVEKLLAREAKASTFVVKACGEKLAPSAAADDDDGDEEIGEGGEISDEVADKLPKFALPHGLWRLRPAAYLTRTAVNVSFVLHLNAAELSDGDEIESRIKELFLCTEGLFGKGQVGQLQNMRTELVVGVSGPSDLSSWVQRWDAHKRYGFLTLVFTGGMEEPRAINSLVAAASSEVVVLLRGWSKAPEGRGENQKCNWIQALTGAFAHWPHLAAVSFHGGYIGQGLFQDQKEAAPLLDAARLSFDTFRNRLRDPDSWQRLTFTIVSRQSPLAVRRSTFLDLGGFDEAQGGLSFVSGYHFTMRLWAAGYQAGIGYSANGEMDRFNFQPTPVEELWTTEFERTYFNDFMKQPFAENMPALVENVKRYNRLLLPLRIWE